MDVISPASGRTTPQLEGLLDHDPRQLGPYRVLARLGGGGMGTVYLGETASGESAALKVVKAELARDPEFCARFTREVEAGRRVAGRCVARFLDADISGGAPWLATELVPGPTLDHHVGLEGPLAGDRLLLLAAGLAEALVAIHGAGLVHRDLKPGNVILAQHGPKVIDFGVAGAEGSAALTTAGSLVGSPAYMSPEQAAGREDVGPAADIFSWASCIVFAARGEPPFGRGEAAGMLYKIVHQPPDLSGVPAELLPVVEASLDKDPARRPTAARLLEVCSTLAGLPAGGAGGLSATVPSGVSTAAAVAGGSGPVDRTMVQARDLRAALPPRPVVASQPSQRRRRGPLVAVLCVPLLAGLIATGVALRPKSKPEVLTKSVASGQAEVSTTSAPPGTVAPAEPAAVTTVPPAGDPGAVPTTLPPAPATTVAPAGPSQAREPRDQTPTGGPATPPGAIPTPTTVPKAVQLVVDDASDTATAKASGSGDWAISKYAQPYQGPHYRTIKAMLTDDRPFAFSFLVRDGEQMQRTIEAWWTSGRPGEPNSRNPAVPFIVRNARGEELARVPMDQRSGHGTWNHIGRYTFTPGWNTVLISRITDPAQGQDVVADAVRVSP